MCRNYKQEPAQIQKPERIQKPVHTQNPSHRQKTLHINKQACIKDKKHALKYILKPSHSCCA